MTDSNPANHFGDAAAIHIVKLINGQDDDAPTGPHVPVGSTVTFTYVVTNTGNVPLANVTVVDDKLGASRRPRQRRHQRQRPARPDRDLDLHEDRHRLAGQ